MTAEKKRLIAAMCILLVCFLCTMTGCTAPAQTVGFPVAAAVCGGAEGIAPAENMTVVPDDIWEKVLKQPDTMEFASNFYYYGDSDLDMDISSDVTEGEVPLLLQWDKRWGYALYGGNYMGINGCAPTALTIVYAGLTGKTDVTPYDMAQYAVDNGLKTICITDHYWDDTVYSAYGKGAGQTTAQIKSALPLPRKDGIRFLFGAETEWTGISLSASGKKSSKNWISSSSR